MARRKRLTTENYAWSRVCVDCFDEDRMRSETKPYLVLVILGIIVLQLVYATIFTVEMLISDQDTIKSILVLAVVYTLAALSLTFSGAFLELIYVMKFGRPMYDAGNLENVRNVWNVRVSTLWFFFVVCSALWIDYSANFDADGIASEYRYGGVVSFHKLISLLIASTTVFHISSIVLSMQGYYPSEPSNEEYIIIYNTMMDSWDSDTVHTV